MAVVTLAKTCQLLHDPRHYHGFHETKTGKLHLIRVDVCLDQMFDEWYWDRGCGYHGVMDFQSWLDIYTKSFIQVHIELEEE